MSLSSSRTVNCSNCNHAQEFTVWDSVNGTLDPDLKEKLMRGALFKFTCTRCRNTATVMFPLIYHDMRNHVLICLERDGSHEWQEAIQTLEPVVSWSSEYRWRLVRSLNSLNEKILIFEHGLSDHVIEALKAMLHTRLQPQFKNKSAEIFFSGTNHSARTLQFVLLDDLPKPAEIGRGAYDRSVEILGNALKKADIKRKLLEVDSKWLAAREAGSTG